MTQHSGLLINNLKMSTKRPSKVESLYRNSLMEYKHTIESNIYARELENKYHKTKHYPIKTKPKLSYVKETVTHNWPVESRIFAQILKNKLEDNSKNPLKPRKLSSSNRSSISSIRRSLMSSRQQRRIQTSYFNSQIPKLEALNVSKDNSPSKPKGSNPKPFAKPMKSNLSYALAQERFPSARFMNIYNYEESNQASIEKLEDDDSKIFVDLTLINTPRYNHSK